MEVKASVRSLRNARFGQCSITLLEDLWSSLHNNPNMCFDDRTRYTTRTRVEIGVRFKEEVGLPRHRSSWRRRYGAHYYPSRYYAHPPRDHYIAGSIPLPARYPANVGYPRAMAATAMVPRGYVHGTGGYMSGGRALMPSSHNMVSVTERSFLSSVWPSSRLPVPRRLSTCSG